MSIVLSLATAAVLSATPVTVEIFTESYCPCSGTFHAQYLNNIVPLVGSISLLNRSWDGHVDGDHVRCFHGEQECIANTLQACAAHLALSKNANNYIQWLNYTVCINGPCEDLGCPGQYQVGFPKHESLEKDCASKVGLSWNELNACFTGPLGKQLIMADAVYDKQVGEEYGLQGLPVVKVNGKMFSKFWDCDSFKPEYHKALVTAICDAYTGTDKPAACN